MSDAALALPPILDAVKADAEAATQKVVPAVEGGRTERTGHHPAQLSTTPRIQLPDNTIHTPLSRMGQSHQVTIRSAPGVPVPQHHPVNTPDAHPDTHRARRQGGG